MDRVAIFAHYDRDGLIDQHVLYYLRGLNAVADRVLFVSDCELAHSEAAKLAGVAELVAVGRHGEYDFGSWKRGLAYLGDRLADWDELILANDSCYAPIFPFDEAFARMSVRPCDAWSAMAATSAGQISFLNSFFLVFRRPILNDPEFLAFWPKIEPQPYVGDVVSKYEFGLSRLLMEQGYRLDSLMRDDPLTIGLPFLGYYVRRLMSANRVPWLKVRLYRDNPFRVVMLGRTLGAVNRHYPRRLIDNHIRRLVGMEEPAHYHFLLGSFDWIASNGRMLRIVGRTRRDRWWKMYVQLFGVTVLAFALPLRKRGWQFPR